MVVFHEIHGQLEEGGQSAIDPYNTITPPLPIDHRSMLHQLHLHKSAQHICISMLYCETYVVYGIPWIYGQSGGWGAVSLA